MPSDPRSSFGVAQSLAEAGKHDRAVVLLQLTLELASEDEGLLAEANLALARLLAEHAGDLPAAIARARRVTGLGRTAVDARAFEAVWRSRLGDVAGATLGFSRAAEVIAACSDVLPGRAAFWLKHAADFCVEQLGDDVAAERYLTQALRFLPKDPAIGQAYRTTAARLALVLQKRLAPMASAPVTSATASAVVTDTSETPTMAVDVMPVADVESANVEDSAASADPSLTDTEEVNEQRVDVLKSQLLASPTAVVQLVDELVTRLHALGRDEEAYALLRSQYDDASGPERNRIAQALRRVVTSLIETANEQGRAEDADLYSLVMAGLDG